MAAEHDIPCPGAKLTWQPYKVVNRHGESELCRYPAYLVAGIKADGSFDEASARSVCWPGSSMAPAN